MSKRHTFWVICGGQMVANGEGPNRSDLVREAHHYAFQYQDEGPVFAYVDALPLWSQNEDDAMVGVQARVAELLEQHGTYRAAGKALGMAYPFVFKLHKGLVRSPSPETIRKLGLDPKSGAYKRLRRVSLRGTR